MPPTNCNKRGQDAVIYWNTGTCATPVWSLHEGMTGDITMGLTIEKLELSLRKPDAQLKEYIMDKGDLSVTGTTVTDGEYAGNVPLDEMITTRTAVDFLILSGPLSNGINEYGFRGKMFNFDRTLNAPDGDSMTNNIDLAPAACTDCPVRLVKTTGGAAPVDV